MSTSPEAAATRAARAGAEVRIFREAEGEAEAQRLGTGIGSPSTSAPAVGVHGWPRATKGLDVWVEASSENAPRRQALADVAAPERLQAAKNR